jgi:hypothetical protein
MKPLHRLIALGLTAFCFTLNAAQTGVTTDWPNWRGPRGDGTTTTAKNLPEAWGPETNIKWKREMPAWSGSSPMVLGDKIFLNSPSKEEAAPVAEATPTPPREGNGPA